MNKNQFTCSFSGCMQQRWFGSKQCYIHYLSQNYSQGMKNLVSSTATTGAQLPVPERSPWVNTPGTPQNSFRGLQTWPGNSSATDTQAAQRQEDMTASYHSFLNSYPGLSGLMGGPGLPVTQALTNPAGRQSSVSGAVGLPERTQPQRQPQTTGQPRINLPAGQYRLTPQSGQYGGNQQNGQYDGNQQSGQHGGNQQSGQHGGNQQSGQHGGNQQSGQHGGNQQSGQHGGNQQSGQYGLNQGTGQYDVDRGTRRYGVNYVNSQPALNRSSCDYGVNRHTWHPTLNQPMRQPRSAQGGTHPGMNGPTMSMQQRSEETVVNHLARQSAISQAGMFNLPPLQHGMSQPLRMAQPTGHPSVGQPLSQQFMAESARRAGWNLPTSQAEICQPARQTGMILPTRPAGENQPEGQSGRSLPTLLPGTSELMSQSGPSQPARLPGMNQSTSQAVTSGSTSHDGPPDPSTGSSVKRDQPTAVSDSETSLQSVTGTSSVQHDRPAAISDTSLQSLRTPSSDGLGDSVTSIGLSQGVASSADQNSRSSHAPCVTETHSEERSGPTTTSKQLQRQQTVNAASNDSLSSLSSQSLEHRAKHQHTVTGASDGDFLSTPFSRVVPDPPGRLEIADEDDIIFVGSENLPKQAGKQESDANEDAVIFMGSENVPVFSLPEQIVKEEPDVNEDDDIVFQGMERRPGVNGAAKKKEVTYVLLSREDALDSDLEEMQEDSSAPVTGPSSDATSCLNKVDSTHTVASDQQEPDTEVASSTDKQQSQPSANVHPIASSPDKQQSQPSAEDGSVTLDNAEIDSDDDFIVLDFSDEDEDSFVLGSQQSQEHSQATQGDEMDSVPTPTAHQATSETECDSEHRLTTLQDTSSSRKHVELVPAGTEATASDCVEKLSVNSTAVPRTADVEQSGLPKLSGREKTNVPESASVLSYNERSQEISLQDEASQRPDQPAEATQSAGEISILEVVSLSGQLKTLTGFSRPVSSAAEGSGVGELLELSGRASTSTRARHPAEKPARRVREIGYLEADSPSRQPEMSCSSRQPAPNRAKRASRVRVPVTISVSESGQITIVRNKTVSLSEQPIQSAENAAVPLSSLNKVNSAPTVAAEQQETGAGVASSIDKQQSQPSAEVAPIASSTEQSTQSAENTAEAVNEMEVVETVSLSEQLIQSAEKVAVPLSEQLIQSAESVAEAASEMEVVETVSLSEQFIQSAEATSDIPVVEAVSPSETDVNKDDGDIVFQGVERGPGVNVAAKEKEETNVLLIREDALDLEEMQEDSSAPATVPSSDATSSFYKVNSAHTVAAEQQETSAGVTLSIDKQQSQPFIEVASIASSTEQSTQSAQNTAEAASEIEAVETVSLLEQLIQAAENAAVPLSDQLIQSAENTKIPLSEQLIQSTENTKIPLSEQLIQSTENTAIPLSEQLIQSAENTAIPLSEQLIQSAENTGEAANEIIVLEPVSLSEQSIQSAENTAEATDEIIVLEPVSLSVSVSEQSIQSAEKTTEATNESIVLEPVSLSESEQSIQSAENTTEAASEIHVVETVSLSEQSIQSAENMTEAASEIHVVETVSLSEQSIQSAENTAEAASEIRVVETVSLSGQSIQSAENTTEAASEIRVVETVSLSEQFIQSAENTTEAASEIRVVETVSLSEQSIQSAENTTEAASEIRVVETVSLSGQSCNWSTQPARAKPLNALSMEAYYRCGGFDGRCSFHTLIPTQLELHLREVHPRDDKYPCVHCGSQELGHDDLLQHLEGHLGLQSLALYCSHLDCDFSSFSPEEVIAHMGVCHADYHNHICWRCCAKFGTLREFSAHVKQNLVTIIKCPHCSAKDVNRKSVLSHIVTSHPDHGRMVGIQKALVCQERKLNNWSGQIGSGGANRDQGPPVLDRIEPLPSSHGLPQGGVSAEHSSVLSSKDGDLSSVCGVPGASTERKVCVIAPMTEIKAESPPPPQAEQEGVVTVKQEYEETVFDEGISAARQKETDVADSDRRTCETSSAGSYEPHGDSQTSPKEPDCSRANLPRILGLGENLQQEDNGRDRFSVASNRQENKDNASNSSTQGNKDIAFYKKRNEENFTREGNEEQEDAAIAINPVSENFDFEDEAEDSAAAEDEPDNQDETMSASTQDLQPASTGPNSDGTEFESVGTAPDSVDMRPETVGTRPKTVGTRPETVGTRPETVGTRPETVGTRPETVGTRPETVGTRPETVGTRPETVGTRPETVGTRPETVGTRPETVGTRTETVGTRPAVGTRPETVATRPETVGTRPETVGTEQSMDASTTQCEEEPAEGSQSPHCDAEAWINLTYSQQDLDDSVDALEILCRFCDHGSRTVADHVQHIHAFHPERFEGFACRVCDFVSADPELRSAHKCRRLRSRAAAGLTGEDLSPQGNKKTAPAIASGSSPKLPSSCARTRVYVRSEKSWVDGELRSISSWVDEAERTPHAERSSCGVDGAEMSTTEQCNAGENAAQTQSSSPAMSMRSSSATGPCETSLPQSTEELDSPALKSTLAKARQKLNVSALASGNAVDDDDGSRPKRTTACLPSKSNMAAVKEAKKPMLYCKLCRFSRRSVEKLCRHVYRAHKSVMKCPLCGVHPAGDNAFYRHLSDKHAEERDNILSKVSAFNWITELAAEAGESDCDKTKAESEKAQLVSSKNCKVLVSGDGIKPGSVNCDEGKPSQKRTKLASSKSKHYKGNPPQKGTKIASSKLCKGKALTTKMKPVPSKKKSRCQSALYFCKLCSHSGRSQTWMSVHVYLQHKEVMKCPCCNAHPTNDRGLNHHLSVRHPAHKDALYKQHRSLAWLTNVCPSAHDTGHKAKTSTSASQKRKHDSCENVSGEEETLAQWAAKKFKAPATSQPSTAKKIKASKTPAESAVMKLIASPTQTTSKNVKPSPAQTSTPKRRASEISQQSAAKKLKTSTQKPGAVANKGFKWGIIHCKLCPKVGRSKDKMYLHLYARHPEVQCSACSTQVSAAAEFRRHLKEKHPEQEKALYEQSKPANWLRFPDDPKLSKKKGRWVLSKKVQNPMRMLIRKASTASTVSKLSDIDNGGGSSEAPTSAFDAVSVTNQEGTCFAQDSQEAEVFPSNSNSPELDSYATEDFPTHGSELDSYNTEVFPTHGSELDSNTNNTARPTERCSNNAQLASDSVPSDSVAMDTAASDEQHSGDANVSLDLHPSERGIFLSDGTTMDKVKPGQQCTNNAACALGSNLSEVAALSSDSEAMDTGTTPKEPESNSQQLQSIPSSAAGNAKDAVVSTPSADGVVLQLETRVAECEMEYRCPHCTANHKTRRRFYEHLCYHYHYRCYQCAHCSFQAFSESAVVNHSKKSHSQAPEVHHHIKQRTENRIHLVSEKALVPVSAPYTERRLLALERAKQKKLLKQSERQQLKAQKLLNKVPKKGKSSPGKISLKKTKKAEASPSSKKEKNFSEISRSGERKWLMCPYCRGERKTQTAIESEIRYHIHYKPFCCPYCEVTSGSEKFIKNHIPKAHPGEPVTVRFEGIEKKEERLKELLARAVALSQSTVKATVSGNVKMKYRKDGDSANVKMKYRKGVDSDNVKMKYRKGVDSGNVKIKYRKGVDSGNVKMKYRKVVDSGNVKKKYRKVVDSGGESDVHRCSHCDSFWFRGNKRGKAIIREKMAQHVRKMHGVCCSRCPFRTTDREALSSHVLTSHPTVNAEDAHPSESETGNTATRYSESETGNTAGRYSESETGNTAARYSESRTGNTATRYSESETGNTATRYSKTETGNTPTRYSESETRNTAARYSESRTGNTATRYSESETGNTATRYSESETGNTATRYSETETGNTPTRYSETRTGNTATRYSESETGNTAARYSESETGNTPTRYSETETGNTAARYSDTETGNTPTRYSETETGNTATRYSETETGNTPTRYSETETGNTAIRYSETETGKPATRYSESETNPSTSNSEAGAQATLSHDTGAKVASFSPDEIMPANFLFDNPPAHSSSEPEGVVDEACGSPQHWNDAFNAEDPASVEADDLL